MDNKIKLNDSIIPAIPFIWYREEEIVCPINYISYLSSSPIPTYLIIQNHIIKNCNLYICLHSLLYYELHKSTTTRPITIPSSYNINISFEVMMVPLIDSEIKEISGGLKINEYVNGSVFIHDGAFSPPGCFHFQVNEEKDKNIFICFIKCKQLKIEIRCLFILLNCVNL